MSNLIKRTTDLVSTKIGTLIDEAFEQIDDDLFNLAERAPDNKTQSKYFEGMRDIRLKRQRVIENFKQDWQLNVKEFVAGTFAETIEPGSGIPNQGLSLINDVDLEESLAISNMVAKAENRFMRELFGLNRRMAVIHGGTEIDNDHNPCAPRSICLLLQRAISLVDAHLDVKLLLYKTFDLHIISLLGNIYQNANQLLIDEGVLPNLVYESKTQSEENDHHDEKPAREIPESPAKADHATNEHTEPSTSSIRNPNVAIDEAIFSAISNLLQNRRQQTHSGIRSGPSQPTTGVASIQELGPILNAFQGQANHIRYENANAVRDSIKQVKQDLLNQLNSSTTGQDGSALSGKHEDTIDLVSMLYDCLIEDKQLDEMVKILMGRLHVPLLQIALKDESFFTQRDHPARQLLNLMGEAGSHHISNGKNDQVLVPHLQQAVDRVINDFEGETEIFEELIEDLGRHINRAKKRAEIAEKRTVEASKGKEKLLAAKNKAKEEIESRIQNLELPRFIRTLLTQPWTDALALIALREGEDSDAWHSALDVANLILESVIPCDSETHREKIRGTRKKLAEELQRGLVLIGYHPDDIKSVQRELAFCQGWALSAAPETRLPDQLANECKTEALRKSEEKLIENKNKAPKKRNRDIWGEFPEKAHRDASNLKLTTTEQKTTLQLKRLPFGTWFEFTTKPFGNKVKLKLCWYSPVTENYLFVDQKGIRAGERPLKMLARDVSEGSAIILQSSEETAVDGAFKNILKKLKNLFGDSPLGKVAES